jgi:hypothetical protein
MERVLGQCIVERVWINLLFEGFAKDAGGANEFLTNTTGQHSHGA